MRKGLLVAAVAVLGVVATAQEKEDRTLLSQEQMNAIINEASVRDGARRAVAGAADKGSSVNFGRPL